MLLAPLIPGEPLKFSPQLPGKDPVVDSVVMANPAVHADQRKQFLETAIKNLQPGLSEMIVHLGHDNAELQDPDYGSEWRQRDYDFVTSAESEKMLEESHMVLIQWRELAKAAEVTERTTGRRRLSTLLSPC